MRDGAANPLRLLPDITVAHHLPDRIDVSAQCEKLVNAYNRDDYKGDSDKSGE